MARRSADRSGDIERETLADAIYPHFAIVAEGANIFAGLHLDVSVQLPDGGRILVDIAQRVSSTGALASAR